MKRENIIIGLTAAAAGITALETTLRMQYRREKHRQFDREIRTPGKPWERFDQYSGWELKPGFTNEDVSIGMKGFRGADPSKADAFRILCLGGSETFGPAGEKNTYPFSLQQTLSNHRAAKPVEVINAGVTGHATSNMFYRMQRLARLRPDIVLIDTGWGDLYAEPIDTYVDKRIKFGSYWQYRDHEPDCSRLVSLVKKHIGPKTEPYALTFTPKEFVPFNFEYNLSRIIAAVNKMKAHPILLSISEAIPEDNASGHNADKVPAFIKERDFDSLRTVYRSYDAIVRRLAESTNADLIDTAAFLAGLQEKGLFDDFRTLSPEGNRIMGEHIASTILEQELIP